jgi:biopolymer transport protein ExbD
MNIGRKRRTFHDEDAMAAMNDIMFFLMLFFLIISTLSNPNVIKVLLPKADNSNTLAKQPLSVTVKENGEYYLNSTLILKEELEDGLRKAVEVNSGDNTLIVRMDKNMKHQEFIDVMSVGVKLKMNMVVSTTK